MVYKQQFVASIKCDGKILREVGDEVFLPFGSQYSILLKNLSTVSCKVKIFIDGELALSSYHLVLKPSETTEVERYIKNVTLDKGNRFKFIEKTQQIEDFRGNKLEDGLIRIEYQFERQRVPVPQYVPTPIFTTPAWQKSYRDSWNPSRDIWCSTSGVGSAEQLSASYSAVANAGITVPGDISNQKFEVSNTHVIYEEQAHSIILKLVGVTEDMLPIKTPITVKHSLVCTTCGRKNRHGSKFCNQCGTSLTII